MAVAPGELPLPGGSGALIGFGAFIWIVIDSLVALLLFVATLATFDRCLGRVSEAAEMRYQLEKQLRRLIPTSMSGLPRVPRRPLGLFINEAP